MQKEPRRSPFFQKVRAAIRVRHYGLATERAYSLWIRRFIYFHNKRHPADMAEPEVGEFLSHLAISRRIGNPTAYV